MIDFHNPRTQAAAWSQVRSLRWRLGVGALFALGACLVMNSYPVGFSWFLAVMVTAGFDALLGHSYLEARGRADRATAGGLFMWGCAFSAMVFAAMTLHVAAAGGEAGRVLAVLMAGSSVVSAMMFLFQARAFMMTTAAPAAVCLLTIPFLPTTPTEASLLQAELGAACGVAGFLIFVLREAMQNAKLVAGLREANNAARARQAEAELKRAQAEQAEGAKSEFMAVMTHELRTPLNAVIGYAEIIGEDMAALGRSDTAQDAGRIERAARHLLGMIDQILTLTSASATEVGVTVREADVRQIIEGQIEIHRSAIDANNNRLSVRVDPAAARVVTDPEKLSVCIGAFVSNAAKFTDRGLIAVTADCDDFGGIEMLVLSVSDTGVGISADRLEHIFEPFTQLEAANTRVRGGLGLGLAIAKRAAGQLGGVVSVRSELGKGSTFVLRTPLILKPAQAIPKAA